MPNITNIKNELKDVQAALMTATQKGYEMATSGTHTLEEIKAQSNVLDELQIKEALIKQQLEIEEPTVTNLKPLEKGKSLFNHAGEFFGAVKAAGTNKGLDPRLVQATATGQNESVDEDGGFLVPPEYSQEIAKFFDQEAVFYNECRKVQIAGNTLVDTYVKEESRKDGSRHAGVAAYFIGEAEEYTASKMMFGQRDTKLGKGIAAIPVTDELLQDAPALTSLLFPLAAEAIMYKIEDAIMNGSTAPNAPIGILHANNKALVTIAKETNQTAKSFNLMNILKMYTAMPSKQRKNAKWYINEDLELDLLLGVFMSTGTITPTSLADTPFAGVMETIGDKPFYVPPGTVGNEYGLLLGRPVIPCEYCNEVGKAGDVTFTNFKEYMVIERGNMEQQSSIHVRFMFGETMFRFTKRVGGRPYWPYAIEAAKGTTKRSPYVALGAR